MSAQSKEHIRRHRSNIADKIAKFFDSDLPIVAGTASIIFGSLLEWKNVIQKGEFLQFVDHTKEAVEITQRLHLPPMGAPMYPEVAALSFVVAGLAGIAIGLCFHLNNSGKK